MTAGLAVADESTEQVAIPDTPAAIWQSIDEQVKALNGLLASGELEEVHHHAFAVRDLVRTLPDHSQGLSQESLEQVKANVGYVKTLAMRLDEADIFHYIVRFHNPRQQRRMEMPEQQKSSATYPSVGIGSNSWQISPACVRDSVAGSSV